MGSVAKTFPFATNSYLSNFKVLSVAKACCIIFCMRCIGYARISTVEQNLDLQLNALNSAGCETIYQDAGASGAKRERDGLTQALSSLEQGDQLVTWRLDRLGRSLSHLIETVETINAKGAEFRSLTEAIDTCSAGGKLIFHMMGALAEFERSLIIERTKAGQDAARKRGKHIGRKRKLSISQIEHAKLMIGSGQETIATMAGLLNVNRSTLWRALSK